MKIAFRSAFSISELGEQKEYYELFKKNKKNQLIDRLFRCYVQREDAQATLKVLEGLKDVSDSEKLLISKLKKLLINGIREAELYFEDYNQYMPVHIILLDLPYRILDRNIPLEDYDNNEGEPFWMRPQYILEHYSQTYGNYKYKD